MRPGPRARLPFTEALNKEAHDGDQLAGKFMNPDFSNLAEISPPFVIQDTYWHGSPALQQSTNLTHFDRLATAVVMTGLLVDCFLWLIGFVCAVSFFVEVSCFILWIPTLFTASCFVLSGEISINGSRRYRTAFSIPFAFSSSLHLPAIGELALSSVMNSWWYLILRSSDLQLLWRQFFFCNYISLLCSIPNNKTGLPSDHCRLLCTDAQGERHALHALHCDRESSISLFAYSKGTYISHCHSSDSGKLFFLLFVSHGQTSFLLWVQIVLGCSLLRGTDQDHSYS